MYRDLLPSLQNVGLGLAILFQGVFRHLRPLIWPQPATKKSSRRKWESGAWAGEIVLGSFQALVPPYLAAAGHQKIQPQEMRIWGLALRNCCREFSGTCAPVSGRSRPPKIQPEEMRIWGLGLRNCFREFSGAGVPLSGRSWPQKIQPQEMRIWAWQNFPRFPQGHFSLSGPSGRGTVSKNLARVPLFCRLRKLRGATEQLLKDN